MKIGLRMPKLGATMQEGKIVEWHVKPGDRVSPGDVVCEVESDKAVIDVESAWDATVVDIIVNQGETVTVGTVVANFSKD
jgi:pyruvate dehydrogenase E2 component (dihydrolipoamide acetyltransferase)